jgi:signal transduction histidine kinase
VDLVAQRDGEDRIRISVTDRGPGVAGDKQAVIFEKFRQIDASVTRIHGGTGLGLAISKELTTLLGGSIGVRSATGEGATFWVLIPLRIEAAAVDVRRRATSVESEAM